jgi:hypothetical protein
MHKSLIVPLLILMMSVDASAFTKRNREMSMDDGNSSDYASGAKGSAPSGTCTSVPAQAKKAFEKALAFSKSCKYAKLTADKKIAISDYSAKTPTMYVFNQNGTCIDSMKIDWGRGPGANKSGDRSITSCSSGGSYRVPAGMHKTTFHDGATWPKEVSMGMAGLSGQNSYGRAVLIHPSRAGNNAGGPYSIGCTGVPLNKFQNLKSMLGYGSLVYNYFGDDGRRGAGCANNKGQEVTCGPAESVSGAGASGGRGGGRVGMSASEPDDNNVEFDKPGRDGGGRSNSSDHGGSQ